MELFRVFGRILIEGQEKANAALDDVNSRAQKVGQRLDHMGGRMRSVGKGMSLGLTAPLAAAGAAAVKLAVDAEETANKFDVVFRGSVEETRGQLEELTKTIPMTRSQMEGMAAGIQDMLVPMGVARGEASGMSVDMVKLAGDLASFNNVPVAQVLEGMQSALAGSSEPMRRYGVDTRMARLETLALEEGLIEAGGEMTNAAMAQATLIAVQRDSTDAMGDAARTVGSTANQFKFLSADIRQIAEDVGKDLIPITRDLLTMIRGLTDRLAEMEPGTRKVILAIAGMVAVMGPVLLILGSLFSAVGKIIGVLARFGPALGRVASIGVRFIPVVGQIIAIVLALVAVFRNWDAIVYGLGRTWDWLVSKISGAGDWLWDVAQAMSQAVLNAFRMMRDRTVEFLGGMVDGIRSIVGGVRDWLTGTIRALVEGTINLFVRMRDGVVSIFTNIRDSAVNLVMGMVNRIRGLIDRLYDATVGRLKALWNALVGNSIIVDLADDVVGEMARMATGSIDEADRFAKGVEGAASMDVATGAMTTRPGAAGGTTIDMRHSVFRDDRDMEERLRRSGHSMAGAF